MRLKPVTDGNRTFWHWQSTFEAPRGRERELAQMVGTNVYEAGMKALGEFLARPGPRRIDAGRSAGERGAPATGSAIAAPAIVIRAHGGPEVLELGSWDVPAPGAGEVRLRQKAVGVNFIDVYARRGDYPLITPPGRARRGGRGSRGRCRRGRA